MKVKGEEEDDEPIPIAPVLLFLITLILIVALLTYSGMKGSKEKRELEEQMNKPIDPEVEELLHFTRTLVEEKESPPPSELQKPDISQGSEDPRGPKIDP